MPNDVGIPDTLARLSERERSVAVRFANGMTYREIGEVLFIAPATVRTHLSAIYQKLGVNTKIGLARLVPDQIREDARIGEPKDFSLAGGGPPTVAVLPFDNLTADERWGRLADGISADIINDLARHSHIAVIARQTMLFYKGRHGDLRSIGRELNADYVLEGSLQASDRTVRISVQLVDPRNGAGIWSARYDHSLDDLFAMQDAVTQSVISVLGGCYGKFMNLRRDVARRKPPSSLGAYDCYVLGVERLDNCNRASTAEAIRLLSKAVELDPGFALAWSRLGLAYGSEACNAYAADPAASFALFGSCAEKAVSLDPDDVFSRQGASYFRAWRGDLKGAEEENSRALANSPSDTMIMALVADSRALVAGNPEEACALMNRAISLNPNAPQWYHTMLGWVSFVAGRYRESVEACRSGLLDTPSALMFLAMAHAALDETPEAARIAARLASEFPDFTVEGFVCNYPVTNPPALAAIRDGARRAGLT